MIRELNSESFFEMTENASYAVIDCYGDFCYACELLEPVFNGIAAKMPGISFGRINVTEHPEPADALQIFELPTILFYRNGERIARARGSIDEAAFCEYLGALLYGEPEEESDMIPMFSFGEDEGMPGEISFEAPV